MIRGLHHRRASLCTPTEAPDSPVVFWGQAGTLAPSMRRQGALAALFLAFGLTSTSLVGCTKIEARDKIREGNQAYGDGQFEAAIEAYTKALKTDPTSAFGGILALNRALDAATAEEIAKIFTEVIIAPGASDEAMAIIAAKKNLRLLLTDALPDPLTVPSSLLPLPEAETLTCVSFMVLLVACMGPARVLGSEISISMLAPPSRRSWILPAGVNRPFSHRP